MVLKPFEHSVQQLQNTRMLTSGRKSPYGDGVVYLDEGVWFLVLSSFQSNFANSAMWEPFERPPHNFVGAMLEPFEQPPHNFVGAMWEPFEWPPHNFVFASNICPTSVQLLLTRDHEKKV